MIGTGHTALPIRTGPGTVLVGGREMLAFIGCDYLGISFEPAVIDAVYEASRRHGLSVAASRSTTGTSPVHQAIEHQLAAHVGLERSLLVPSGTLANIAACEGLASLGVQTVWIDGDAHPSIRLAVRAAGLTESGADDAQLWCVDGTLPSRGVVTDVVALLDRAGERWLLVDDCHGVGVVGPRGRGACEAVDQHDRLVLTGTGAKALGVGGGFVAARSYVIEALERASMAQICSTAVDVGTAAGLAAVLHMLSNDTTRLHRLRSTQSVIRAALGSLRFQPHSGEPPVYLLALDTPTLTASLSSFLADQGIYAPIVSYPGQPEGSAIRLSLNAGHTDAQIHRLIDALGTACAQLGGPP